MKISRSTGHPGGKEPQDKTTLGGSGRKQDKNAIPSDVVSDAVDQVEHRAPRHGKREHGDSTGNPHSTEPGKTHTHNETALLNKDHSDLHKRKAVDAAAGQDKNLPHQEKFASDDVGEASKPVGNPSVHGGMPPGRQKKAYLKTDGYHPHPPTANSQPHATSVATSAFSGSVPGGVSQFSPAGYSYSSWVRIPYPLSSFVPIAGGQSAAPATPVEPSSGANEKSNSQENGSGKKTDQGKDTLMEAVHWGSGFGMTELRDANVEALNEAGDAIWKNYKATPGTRSDSDDL